MSKKAVSLFVMLSGYLWLKVKKETFSFYFWLSIGSNRAKITYN